jgi:transposase InsO family protein
MVKRVLEEGIALTEAAEAAGVSARTAGKWVRRYRAEGEAGLLDRSSAPRRVHNAHRAGAGRGDRRPAAGAADRPGDRRDPGDADLDRLCRAQADRPRQAQPPGPSGADPPLRALPARRADPYRRQEARPDQRQGRRASGHRQAQHGDQAGPDGALRTGWERVHVCVDDATRLAYVDVLLDEKAATDRLHAAGASFYRSHGIEVERLMTDNGSAYVSVAHALACKAPGIKHLRTRPYRPQTNGKAERFIRTMLREWAYAAVYGSSSERTAALSGWLERYNYRRRHGALAHRPPIQRLYGSSPGTTWLASTTRRSPLSKHPTRSGRALQARPENTSDSCFRRFCYQAPIAAPVSSDCATDPLSEM